MIKTLTSWRALFAIVIVCYHFMMRWTVELGFMGVVFFFMVSGFLTVLHHNAGRDTCYTRGFYSRRLGRIVPLHWLVLAMIIALDLTRVHSLHYGPDLPLHVMLLQSWIPRLDSVYNYSIHSWFLSTMLACVIATPLLLKAMCHSRLWATWTAIAVACTALIIIDYSAGDNIVALTHVHPLARIIDYATGMALAMSIPRLSDKVQHLSFAKATVIELAILAIIVLFITLHATCENVLGKLLFAPLWWIPVAAIITGCTLLNHHEGALGRILTCKPLVWLGTISFEIYILQKPANLIFCYLVAPLCGHYGWLVYDYSFEGTLPVLLLLACAVHRWFTKPVSRLANRMA